MTTSIVDLRAELVELAAERDALRAQLEADLAAGCGGRPPPSMRSTVAS